MSSGDAIAFGGYAAIATAACAAFVAGRFVDEVQPQWRVALDASRSPAPRTSRPSRSTARGSPRRTPPRPPRSARSPLRGRDEVAGWGAGAYLGLALGYALAYLAPPDALVEGLDDLPGAALALGAAAFAALRGAQLLGRRRREPAARRPARAGRRRRSRDPREAAAGAGPRPASSSSARPARRSARPARSRCCTSPRPRSSRPSSPARACRDTGLFDLGARELGQLLLSALWAITGVAALVVGLRRDDRALRLGSLALLLVTVGKVFLYDLAALTSLYRVGSFIGLGLLLLVAAGIWQRMRPAPAARPARRRRAR